MSAALTDLHFSLEDVCNSRTTRKHPASAPQHSQYRYRQHPSLDITKNTTKAQHSPRTHRQRFATGVKRNHPPPPKSNRRPLHLASRPLRHPPATRQPPSRARGEPALQLCKARPRHLALFAYRSLCRRHHARDAGPAGCCRQCRQEAAFSCPWNLEGEQEQKQKG